MQKDVARALEVSTERTRVAEEGIDPLGFSNTEVVGRWKFNDPKVDSRRHGRTVKFARDGRWKD
jgi:hypothetical protein